MEINGNTTLVFYFTTIFSIPLLKYPAHDIGDISYLLCNSKNGRLGRWIRVEYAHPFGTYRGPYIIYVCFTTTHWDKTNFSKP